MRGKGNSGSTASMACSAHMATQAGHSLLQHSSDRPGLPAPSCTRLPPAQLTCGVLKGGGAVALAGLNHLLWVGGGEPSEPQLRSC